MPTTVYDSSFITARLRDKAIANEMQKRNAVSAPIIVPQASYGSYVVENKDNGAITSYTDNNGCYIIDKGCACVLTQNETTVPLGNDEFDITHEITEQVMLRMTESIKYKKQQLLRGVNAPINSMLGITTYRIILKGVGIINWGDDSATESFNFSTDTNIYHTYASGGIYTIKVKGTIYTLQVSDSPNSGGGVGFPNVTSIEVIHNEHLTKLVARNPNLIAITNFESCNTLLELYLGVNDVSITPIYATGSYSGFDKLELLSLDQKPITGEFDCSGLSTNLYYLDLSVISGITDIKNTGDIAGSLTNLNLAGCSNINTLVNIKYLTNLIDLNISYTLISDITGINVLSQLSRLNIDGLTITSGFTDISGVNLLTYLVASSSNITDFEPITILSNLSYLNISDTPVTNITDISNLINLTGLDISNTIITGGLSEIFTLTNLTELFMTNAGLTSITGITSLINLTNLQISNNPSLVGTLDISALTELTTLFANNTGITGIFGSPIPIISDTAIDINLSNCNINQSSADNIAATLYYNGSAGYLGIEAQPILINTTGGYWNLLRNNGWNIY